MIWHAGYIRATKAEKRRIDAMLTLGCAACVQEPEGWPHARPCCQHILEGNVRMGHQYTIPLCAGHHQGIWTRAQRHYIDASAPEERAVALSDGSKPFTERYGTQREIWGATQIMLNLPDVWPESKIFKRDALTEAQRLNDLSTGE
jgi:hypothetical protein